MLFCKQKIHQTPLHLASLYGFTEAVQAILTKKDPGVNMIDNDGRTPLHYAVISNSKNIVSLLCSFQGINLNMIDHVVSFNLFYKDDDNDDEKKGIFFICFHKTPLQIAKERHFHSIASILFNHNAIDTVKS